ncbi:NitT/TauT family transport system ATP-binding protein [Pseudonocardia thermophila]|uniref:NitT/TauT family transport system ATP-binding protein n=1 Tax=Pseudonocardia thermophila TaxID=1848 RepID=A0A1M6U758_PSETH|nr:ABC transporter ATP-binding protein [Pseudonocardia thermophila]SHK65000.1 NitT/TauT family transport system ATP-binding protein [Pseudonocardia thermophila]
MPGASQITVSRAESSTGSSAVARSDERVRLQDVCIVHGRGDQAVVAVEGVDMHVGAREIVSIVGHSGCGKSTLLRAIAGLLPNASVQGRISVMGRSPDEARRSGLISMVFQESVLAPWRTVERNVTLPLEVARGRTRTPRRTASEQLELVGLKGYEKRYPKQLSGGQRQRVSLARALMMEPEVLLMDEPFGALDEITRDEMHSELLRIWETTHVSIVLVTHSLAEAIFLSDRVVVMSSHPGRVADTIEVDFPRPRRTDLKDSPEFSRIAHRIRVSLEHNR